MSATATGPVPANPKIPAALWGLSVLAGMASFLDAAGLIAIATSLAIWQQHYHLSALALGLIVFASQIFLAIGALTGGWIADRVDRQLVFNIDIALLAIGLGVVVVAPNGIVLLIGIAVFGLACGADIPTSLAVISDNAPEWARGRLIGFTQVMWALGIVVSAAIGFAVSALAFAGTRIMVEVVIALAVLTLVTRLATRRRFAAQPSPTVDPVATVSEPAGSDLAGSEPAGKPSIGRQLLSRRTVYAVLLIGFFYTFWNAAAGAIAAYSTYFLVTVSHATQTLATGINLALMPVAAILAFVFVRIADTKWRDRVFYVAGAVQIVGMVIGAATGGTVISGIVAMLLLWAIANPGAGEGIYKVWGQLLFDPALRASAQGITFAIARVALALFLLVIPTIIKVAPTLLLVALVVVVAVSYVLGILVVRVLVQGKAPTVVAEPLVAH